MLGIDFQTESFSVLQKTWLYPQVLGDYVATLLSGLPGPPPSVLTCHCYLQFTARVGEQVGPEPQLTANPSLALGHV